MTLLSPKNCMKTSASVPAAILSPVLMATVYLTAVERERCVGVRLWVWDCGGEFVGVGLWG